MSCQNAQVEKGLPTTTMLKIEPKAQSQPMKKVEPLGTTSSNITSAVIPKTLVREQTLDERDEPRMMS